MINKNSSNIREAQTIASAKVDVIKNDLEARLNKRFVSSARMEHGQIKSTARFVIRHLGHEWILTEDVEAKYIRMYLRWEIKKLIITFSKKWHPQPNRVWLQFRDYCLEMASSIKAKEVINGLKY
jgi:hypothetical protein